MPQLLVAYADTRLASLPASYVTWHVARCTRCRSALAALRALNVRLEQLRQAPPELLSTEFQQQLLETLQHPHD